ncbi:hypothetical protein K491DRAFT_692587 [Lophiostoma macrostomum CBS 122681]|uniref:Uncharacterized protein n=1 Tax=Lophiostoma macrostomum CBS 122681 TaxID=1314788 RepID=A0A6A6T7G5_9PLEO|nr:hypothetical protein K491DRAFT_692587 [Lophiostoma macrostomum CBS 122681]
MRAPSLFPYSCLLSPSSIMKSVTRFVSLVASIATAPLVFAGPDSVQAPQAVVDPPPPPVVEQWIIPSMTLHFMTQFTGVVGVDQWPNGTGFDSEIAFDVVLPSGNVSCSTTWKPDRDHLQTGNLPPEYTTFPCVFTDGEDRQNDNVTFGLSRWYGLGERRAELSFLVKVWCDRLVEGNIPETFQAEAPITANQDNSEPTSYLTCMYWQPWEGMKCEMHGIMSNHEDVQLNVTKVDHTVWA